MRIKVDKVTVYYSSVPALANVTLEVEEGEVCCVIGPNGAGKTTLLKTIARILTPHYGAVYIDGKDYRLYDGKELAKVVAYVDPHVSRSIPSNVAEFIITGRYPHQRLLQFRESEADVSVIRRVAEELGLAHLLSRRLDQLSSGELQRVIIARALVQEPKVMLLDEPSAFLDLKYRLEVLELINRIARVKGSIIILALHDLYLASLCADKIVALNSGTIVAAGKPNDVLNKSVLEPLYKVSVEVIEINGRPIVVPLKPLHRY